MTPPLPRLDAALAASSPLAGRLVFVAASPRTGAEQLTAALDALPGAAAAPAPTHLFEQGIDRLFTKWMIGAHTDRVQGISRFVDEGDFCLATRLLLDTVLAMARPGEEPGLVVEYSSGNSRFAHLIAALYPDATLIHLVADGRRVAARASLGRYSLTPAEAARSWCDDQRAVLSSGHPRVLTVRTEDLAADPVGQLELLCGRLGLPGGAAVQQVAPLLTGLEPVPTVPPQARAAAIVEDIGSDLLEHFGYPAGTAGGVTRAVAKAEIRIQGARQLGKAVAVNLKEAAWNYRHHRRRLAQELAEK